MSPGLYSEAPFVVRVVEFCISCPGDRLEAPGLSAAIALAPAASKMAAERTMARFIATFLHLRLSLGNGQAAYLFRTGGNQSSFVPVVCTAFYLKPGAR